MRTPAGVLRGSSLAILLREVQVSRQHIVFETELLITSYGRKGETGQIVDMDRRFFSTFEDATQAVSDRLIAELYRQWPEKLTIAQSERMARGLVFQLSFERKVVVTYGTSQRQEERESQLGTDRPATGLDGIGEAPREPGTNGGGTGESPADVGIPGPGVNRRPRLQRPGKRKKGTA